MTMRKLLILLSLVISALSGAQLSQPGSAAALFSPAALYGDYIPVFQSALQFDNDGVALGTHPFAIYSGGGLIGSSNGNQSEGYKRLPHSFDQFHATRTDFLLKWDGTE